ncbi:MAG: hypothetical protein AAF517_15285 [Planctomycetota bacterium]
MEPRQMAGPTMMMMACWVILSGILSAGCTDHRESDVDVSRSGLGGGYGWVVQWGVRESRLAYVALSAASKGQAVTGMVQVSKHGSRSAAYIPAADLHLPTDEGQLIEVIDGVYRMPEGRVTIADLHAYFDSKPKVFSLDELLEFSRRRE